MKTMKCVLCKKKFIGYGNNAQPLANGLCCDDCNIDVVVARNIDVVVARIKNVFPHKISLSTINKLKHESRSWR